ncbi:hypothetical protein [Sporosarcina sp. FSL K6-3457]|uniref:hypothetical protein n=1 Tax=Sporosarcina sp. FSL K6-3457 TaxID=2978204 RepID=UPI0030F60542
MKKLIGFLSLSTILLLTACGSKEEPEEKVEASAPVEKVEESKEIKEELVEEKIDLDSYISDTFDPFVRHITANIDTNWEFYMLEPFDRLEAGGSLDAFHSDLSLLVNLYNGVVKSIDEEETPAHFSELDIDALNYIKSELKNSINKRIEAAYLIMDVDTAEETFRVDVSTHLLEGNKHLENAVGMYSNLLN